MARPRGKIYAVCQNENCHFYLKEDGKDIIKRGKYRIDHQRYFCNHCKTFFIETKGSLFYHKHLSKFERVDIFKHLIKRKSIRSIERITGHHRDTIGQLLEDFVLHAEMMNSILLEDEELKNYGQFEIDKGWSFIKKIKRNLRPDAKKTKRENIIASQIHPNDVIDKNLDSNFSELDRMVCILGLSQDIKETSALVYSEVVEKNLIRGIKRIEVAAAVLYAVCRQRDVPRTFNEIGEVSKVGGKKIGRIYKVISKGLSWRFFQPNSIDFVPRFCSGLKLDGKVQSTAVEILRTANEKELNNGKDPISFAAAAIYIASILRGDIRSQREIAQVTGSSETTIRNTFKELVEELDIYISLK